MRNQSKAYIHALSAVFLWSTVAAVFKLTLRRADFLTLLFYSSLISAATLFLVLLLQGKAKTILGGSKHRGVITRSMLAGFLNPFLYYFILFQAYTLLPAQEAQPLNYTWAVVIALLAVPMLGEPFRSKRILALLVSFLGVLVISTRGDLFGLQFASPWGVGLALGSSIIWATYWLMNVKDERDPFVKLFLNFFFGFLFTLAVVLIFSRTSIPSALIASDGGGVWADIPGNIAFPPKIDLWGLLGCAYVGMFEMGFTFVLWLNAMRLTEATAKVSNLIFFSPFVSLIFIHYIVGETILLSSILGLTLIIGGVVLQQKVK